MMPSGGHLLEAGAVLGGRYRLERRIAGGGMASVWLARDGELGRPVAVKILSDVLAEDPSFVSRFRREARVAAGLSHPNLVRVFDFSSKPERPYLVMEYVGGGTLADRIGTEGVVELDAQRVADQLLGAVACIHGAGVVHRDIKPSNVLLDRDGRIRLTDFGIAQPSDATRITRTGELIGTLEYMAPEVRDGEPASERSDLYACGVLLRECLSADPPFHLVALADRLAAPDPAERPASARAAQKLLEAGAAGSAVPTEPLAAIRKRGSRGLEVTARRVIALVVVAGLAALLVVVAIGGGGSGQGSAGQDRGTGHAVRPATTTTTSTTTATVPAPTPPRKKPEAKKPPAEKPPPGLEKKQKGD